MQNNDERVVADIFAAYGISLNKIKEGKKKSPDFFCERGEKKLLFELKTRSGDSDLLSQKEAALDAGHAYAHSVHRNIDTGNKKAAFDSIQTSLEQFQGVDEKFQADYCFIIFQLNDIHSLLTEERLIKALYGIGDVTYSRGSHTALHMRQCRSLHKAKYFEHRNELDGVFIVSNGVNFLPNPFSENFKKLEKGKIFKSIPQGSLLLKEDYFELPPSLEERTNEEKKQILSEKYQITIWNLEDFNKDYISKRGTTSH